MLIKVQTLKTLHPIRTTQFNGEQRFFSNDPKHAQSPSTTCMADIVIDTDNNLVLVREKVFGTVHVMHAGNISDAVIHPDEGKLVWDLVACRNVMLAVEEQSPVTRRGRPPKDKPGAVTSDASSV